VAVEAEPYAEPFSEPHPSLRRWRGWLLTRAGSARSVLRVERRLLGLLRPYRGLVGAGVAVTVASTLVGLAQPWPTKILVDSALGHHRFLGLGRQGSLTFAVVGTLVLFLLSGSLGLAQTAILYGLSQRLIAELREKTFEALTRLSLRYHDEKGAGDSLFRVTNDTYAVESVLLSGVVPMTAALLALVGSLAVLVALDPLLAFLAVVSVPVAAVATHRFSGRINRASMALQQRESDVYSHAEQALVAIRTVQAFGRERHETDRFRERATASQKAMMKLVTEQTAFGLLVDFLLASGLALVTWVAAERAISGRITVGEVLVAIAYAGSLYQPVSSLASTVGELKAAAAGAQRVFEVLDQPGVAANRHAKTPRRRVRGVLAVEAVEFSYRPGQQALAGVDLRAEPGRTVALVGPTGAGKSTVASLILRLYDPDAGRIRLDGVDIRKRPLEWLRDQVALVPQEPILFPESLRENIRYGRLDATDAAVLAAARAANLDELIDGGDGLDLRLGDRGATLSGGQRQRVAIARAMLKDAPVLLLDEPTSALDAATEVEVLEALERLFSDRTCIVIAHRLATVSRADQVVVLDRGQVVQRGPHTVLVRQPGLYRTLHRARFGSARPAAPVSATGNGSSATGKARATRGRA
jgi:ATP-binding cassette subfamily B protein/subfamily B ATP-binding cassette protein MsbA